tara:strand:+ start:3590 stop:4021 length:432 start_codon:yes stop_codon:yes gene_type:complete
MKTKKDLKDSSILIDHIENYLIVYPENKEINLIRRGIACCFKAISNNKINEANSFIMMFAKDSLEKLNKNSELKETMNQDKDCKKDIIYLMVKHIEAYIDLYPKTKEIYLIQRTVTYCSGSILSRDIEGTKGNFICLEKMIEE